MSTPTRSILLYKTEGSMDKAYGLQIMEAASSAGLYHLYYLNGRRGAAMRSNPKLADPVTKLPVAVTLEVANKEFDKVVKSKTKDGYTEDSSGLAYTSSEDAGRISGYRPTLPADLPVKGSAGKVNELLQDDNWGLQEKMDGEHRGLIIAGGVVTGTNKNGLIVDIPSHWQAFAALGEVSLCGEHMRDGTYAVFDLFDKNLDFRDRYARLFKLFTTTGRDMPHITLVLLATGESSKRQVRNSIDARNGEGVVYKDLNASFEEGKNGNSIREKFWADMTCFVLGHNAKRSVSIGATNHETSAMELLGNVTIPENQDFPDIGAMLDVRYLYRFEEGSLEQPTSKGIRTDVNPVAVTTEQILRIKPKSQPMDTSGLSEKMKEELAKTEFDDNMALLKNFMPNQQWSLLMLSATGPNSSEHLSTAQDLAQRIVAMPVTYATDGKSDSAVAQLRYFLGDAEWLILEKDMGSLDDERPGIQQQAFGSADLGQGAELGYISIEEITSLGAVLDTAFVPITLSEHETQKSQREAETASSNEQPIG